MQKNPSLDEEMREKLEISLLKLIPGLTSDNLESLHWLATLFVAGDSVYPYANLMQQLLLTDKNRFSKLPNIEYFEMQMTSVGILTRWALECTMES